MDYTKGEWEAQKSPMGDWMVVTEDTLICREVRHFNVHLIAAAPDMYEALQQALRTFEAHRISQFDDRYRMLSKALAKAEGRDAKTKE